jgi:transcriptional regulator with XRE-family HTH domain
MNELDLKAVRESKGLTLKDIFERTRISVTNLEAIENGNFHKLPPPVFTKSFIKIYAKTLGIDGSSTLACYEQYLEAHNTACRDVESKNIPEPARIHYKVFLWGTFILAIGGLVAFSLSSNKPDIDILIRLVNPDRRHSMLILPIIVNRMSKAKLLIRQILLLNLKREMLN